MKELSYRFEIVRLAVELGDYETIRVQSKNLRSIAEIKEDRDLKDITDLLDTRNLRQALFAMQTYFETVKNKKEDKAEENSSKDESSDIEIDPNLLLLEDEVNEESEEDISLEEMLKISEENFEKRSEASISNEIEKKMDERVKESEISDIDSTTLQTSVERVEEREFPYSLEEESKKSEIIEDKVEEPSNRDIEESISSNEVSEEQKEYPPMTYIRQKFKNNIYRYSPIELSNSYTVEVEYMLDKISKEGYSEEDIESFLELYEEYKKEGDIAEAAQVLLLAASTESLFAQFMLARELYRGEIIKQDYAEAFTQLSNLADKDFAEAICDLGQFYEHGIGIEKDKEMALVLYEEASELGVERARKHFERLKNSRGLKGFLSKLKI